MSEPTLKILIIGPSNVGKSALLKQYYEGYFEPNSTKPTVGIDYRIKHLSVHGQTYCVKFMDTAGQERYRTLSTSYYRGAHGILFVYDLTNRDTFNQMDAWFAEAEANTALGAAAASSRCHFCVVAAKLDSADTNREVSADEGRELALQHSPRDGADGDASPLPPLFFETSARTGENVRKSFVTLVDRIVTAGVPAGGRWAGRSAGPTPGTVSLDAGATKDQQGCSC